MKNLILALLVFATVILVAPAVAGTETLVDPDADFASYKTYEWMKSNAIAEIPEIRQYLVDHIDRYLESAGYKKVESGGDLRVGIQITEDLKTNNYKGYPVVPSWSVGYAASYARSISKDRLIVDLVDAARNHAIWQGFTTETITDADRTNYGLLRKKIDKFTEKMFRDFPPKPKK